MTRSCAAYCSLMTCHVMMTLLRVKQVRSPVCVGEGGGRGEEDRRWNILSHLVEDVTFDFPINCSILLSVGRVCSDALLKIFRPPGLIFLLLSSRYYLSLPSLFFRFSSTHLSYSNQTYKTENLKYHPTILTQQQNHTKKKIAKKAKQKKSSTLTFLPVLPKIPKQLPSGRKKRGHACVHLQQRTNEVMIIFWPTAGRCLTDDLHFIRAREPVSFRPTLVNGSCLIMFHSNWVVRLC